jgi:hypothetical protein
MFKYNKTPKMSLQLEKRVFFNLQVCKKYEEFPIFSTPLLFLPKASNLIFFTIASLGAIWGRSTGLFPGTIWWDPSGLKNPKKALLASFPLRAN